MQLRKNDEALSGIFPAPKLEASGEKLKSNHFLAENSPLTFKLPLYVGQQNDAWSIQSWRSLLLQMQMLQAPCMLMCGGNSEPAKRQPSARYCANLV